MKKNKIIVSDKDYTALCEMLRVRKNELGESSYKLASELKRAQIVSPAKLESDVVRMYSRVKVKDENGNPAVELTIVYPEESDISQRKISVFAPMGTALLGFRKGDRIEWEVPSGKRIFIIEDVINDSPLPE